jgi:hypothetical protein
MMHVVRRVLDYAAIDTCCERKRRQIHTDCIRDGGWHHPVPSGWLCSLMPDQPVMVHAAHPTPHLGNPTSQRTSSPLTYNLLAHLPPIRHNFRHERSHFRITAPPPPHQPPARAQNPDMPLCARALSRKREFHGDFSTFSSPVPTTTYNTKTRHPFKSVRAHHVHRPCIRRARATDHRLCDGRCEQPTAPVSQIES